MIIPIQQKIFIICNMVLESSIQVAFFKVRIFQVKVKYRFFPSLGLIVIQLQLLKINFLPQYRQPPRNHLMFIEKLEN